MRTFFLPIIIITIPLCSPCFAQLSHSNAGDLTIFSSNDYWSNAVSISGTAFDLNGKWYIPADNSISETGTWITPTATGMTLLASLLFGIANTEALNSRFRESVTSLIELSQEKLEPGFGQLFRYSYNSDQFGAVTDVTSVRFIALAKGQTPEMSLAQGPIDQISAFYSENAVFPDRSTIYVWIYKQRNGNLLLSTIKPPFSDALNRAATQQRVLFLKDSIKTTVYTDANIERFNNIQLWTAKLSESNTAIINQERRNEIEELNRNFTSLQNEFDNLYNEYSHALKDQEVANSLLQFIDVSTSIVGSLSKLQSEKQSRENADLKAAYQLLYQNLKNKTADQNGQLSDLMNQLYRIDARMRTIMRKNRMTLPEPIRLPPLD